MIIDSSALVAIVLREPDFVTYIDRISEATSKQISAASLLETSMVVNREKGSAGFEILLQFIFEAGYKLSHSPKRRRGSHCIEAHLRFGKGTGHPAQLNS